MSEVIDPGQVGNKSACPYCHKQLANKSCVDRHINQGSCRVQNPTSSKKELLKDKQIAEANYQRLKESVQDMERNITESMEKTMEKAMEKAVEKAMEKAVVETMEKTWKSMGHNLIPITPMMVNNQNLNILCLGKSDNLLDMLSSTEGLANALTYMKDCVLAQLAGDCRILERVYKLETEQAAIMYVNKSKTKFQYYDERQRLTTESSATMAKKIAGILQRSYLKGGQAFKTDILGEQREGLTYEKMPELEAYDSHLWNEHVQRLADDKYQKKLLRSLKIPMAPN